MERSTRLPIASAIITAPGGKSYTSSRGFFRLASVSQGDTIKIVHDGFKPYKFSYRRSNKPDTIKIIMEPVSLMLNEVSVKAMRNLNMDSVNNREQFASVFNHRNTALQEVLISNVRTNKYVPYNYVDAPNSTTTLVSVNLLQVLNIASQKKSKVSKLQKELIANEQFNYAGQRFSKQKINAITGLKGDSLQKFTEKYQLGLGDTKKMTDYDMMMYIKKSYADFVKN